MPIRVALAEDNLLVREGLRQLLATAPEIDVVAVCADRDSLLEAVAAERPDAVVTDIRMPPTNKDEGIEIAARLRQTSPGTGVVVLSQFADAAYALRLFDLGASGRAYLLKERVSDLEQLVRAIQEVVRGGSVVDPRVVESLITARSRKKESALASLTPRETDVLAQVAEGKNNAAIAAALFLTERGVEKHINAIFSKLGLSEQIDLHRRVKAALIYLMEEGGQHP
ncbi:MAG TPA: response regulator transcription factor [Candidatus Dormibacteraeota bacterium]|nr:response regulator transcription factor [Candidatus Dormibacteraeota bacterium]